MDEVESFRTFLDFPDFVDVEGIKQNFFFDWKFLRGQIMLIDVNEAVVIDL